MRQASTFHRVPPRTLSPSGGRAENIVPEGRGHSEIAGPPCIVLLGTTALTKYKYVPCSTDQWCTAWCTTVYHRYPSINPTVRPLARSSSAFHQSESNNRLPKLALNQVGVPISPF